MRVAIVHYHLRPGGVTRVIENAVRALAAHDVRVAVLAGEPPEPDSPLSPVAQVVDPLAYSDEPLPGSADRAVEEMDRAAARLLGGQPDLWHIHNHSLGKNLSLPLAVGKMAAEGRRLLLQIHDFPEDGRPGRYRFMAEGLVNGDGRLGEMLYPRGPHVHYAPLNARDQHFLEEAGASADRVHRLPNAVASLGASPDAAPQGDERILLYVTRAIRRKNLGEILLWAAMEGDARFQVSRAPRNPAARRVYERWVAFADSLKLPVEFEVGERDDLTLGSLISRAGRLITTSVAEGFGLAFLEPWLAGRPLVGRDLPEVTEGLKESGLDLLALYEALRVPVEWFDERILRTKLTLGYVEMLEAYGRAPSSDLPDRLWEALCGEGRIDFGRLDEPLQEDVIRRVAASQSDREIIPKALPPAAESGEPLAANRRVVEEHYGLEDYGRRLAGLYKEVAASDTGPVEALDGGRLLDRFLAPSRFSLLRTL